MDLTETVLPASAQLAINSLEAARHPSESCGTNGLPLTPNSIAILGQAQILRTFRHAHLCTFLDCARGKHERVVCVQEHYANNLKQREFSSDEDMEKEEAWLWTLGQQVLHGLDYLHEHCVVHGTLQPDNVFLDDDDAAGQPNVKLFNVGLGHITHYGSYVAFPIFNPRFVAPEVLAVGPPGLEADATAAPVEEQDGDASPANSDELDSLNPIPPAPEPPHDARCDVWSLGMILACRVLGLHQPWPALKLTQIVRKVLSLHTFQGNVFDRLVREHEAVDSECVARRLSPRLRRLIDACLQPSLDDRPSARQLLKEHFGQASIQLDEAASFPTQRLRCRDLVLPPAQPVDDNEDDEPVRVLTIQEVYYLWQLAGGDVLAELRNHGLMVTRPPILSLPKIVLNEGHMEGQRKERCSLYDPVIITLSMKQLRSCLDELTAEDCYPLLLSGDKDGLADGRDNDDADETANLPLVIKEGDVRYQFRRIVLYRRLLQCYPFQRSLLMREARTDALPHYRAYIWAALLGIEHDTRDRYESIDKETWTPTDRQIEVDIPRCHQYNNLLASPEGHRKFKRVLKAWVATNPQYVYWQGLDSLCAPFLYLNFNDESLAFACLSAFIPKYLYGMFRRDNAPVIQEYLAKFSHVQAFHDPELFNHLDGIGFIPDLYAIPWVLTMFAHVFPLHNIFHLWDKLLLGNSAFPLCIGLAVLMQLRERLLRSEFNDCILLFSDLPAIDIEQCVKDSVRVFCTTPKSLTYRKYGSPPQQQQPGDDTKANADDRHADLSMDSITLAEQKAEKVSRISGAELLSLLGLRRDEHDHDQKEQLLQQQPYYQQQPGQKSRALVLDVRPTDEYKLGTLPDSLHLPATTSFTDDGQLASPALAETLQQRRKGKVICVVGSRTSESASTDADAQNMAQSLLALNFSRVCVLHLGIEIFRPVNGVLCVPNA